MAISPTVNPTQPSWPGIVTERPASRLDVDGQASPAPMRILSSNESIAQQVEEFLEPLADRYLNGRNYSAEERSALSQELDLVVLESLQLVRGIYPPTVSPIRLFFKLNNSNRYSLAPKCSIEIGGKRRCISATVSNCNRFRTRVYSSHPLRYDIHPSLIESIRWIKNNSIPPIKNRVKCRWMRCIAV